MSTRSGPGRRNTDAEPLIARSTLYALFQQAPAIISVLRGSDHVFELVNPGYQQLFRDRQLLGRPIREALSDLANLGFVETLDRVYTTGEPYVAREARVMLDREGNGRLEETFFNFVYQPMFSDDHLVEGIIVFAFDVTSETRRQKLGEERLRESEEIFRLLVDSVQDYAIFLLDVEGRVASWNTGARRIKGYEPDEIIGRHFSVFYTKEDIADGKPERILKEATERGRVQTEGWRVRKDGTTFRADVTITAVHDASGTLRGFAKVTRDVTEKRKAEEAQRDLAIARQVDHAKDEFLAVISHELRTPLTSILGWARMLRMGDLDARTTEEALQALERSAQAQVHLIEDLLDDTRITSGKLRLQRRPLQLKSIIETALTDVMPAAEGKRIRIEAEIDCETCPIMGDPIRLQQVIWNVLSNAIKFTPERGNILVRVTRDDAHAEIVIRDTGRGFDADMLPQLFHRFRQADSASERKAGVGLGLAISKYLVEQHGGTIQAASEGRGKGATFTIRLPISIEASEEFTVREPNRAEDLPDLSGIRVLLVEDEADNRDVLSRVIERCGGDVRCSTSGEDALALLQAWTPDVIISDIALPGMDGCQFLGRARKTSDTPALALTVFGSAEEEARVRQCGFEVFRQKPIEPADLAHDIKRLSQRHS